MDYRRIQMVRAAGAIGAIIAAGMVIERIRAQATPDMGHTHRPEAYCLHCRARHQIDKPQTVTMRNGGTGTKGWCPACGKGLFSVGSKAA